MSNYSSITLIGYIGQNPKVLSNDNGSFATFSLGVTHKWKNKAGHQQKDVEWYSCSTNNPGLISYVQNYCNKGMLIYIEGRPYQRTYTNATGVEKSIINVNVSTIIGLSSKDDQEKFTNKTSPLLDNDFSDDEIPF